MTDVNIPNSPPDPDPDVDDLDDLDPDPGHKARGTKRANLRVKQQQRRKQALELRLAGVTYETIAERLGYSNKTSAYRAIKESIAAIPREPATELRQIELERYDRIQLRLWTRLQQGDTSVVGQLLRIMDQRAKLLGIYSLSEGTGDNSSVTAMFAGMLASAQAFAQANPGGVPAPEPEEEDDADAGGGTGTDAQP